MKNLRLALMFVACAAAYPAFGQNTLPQCETSNYDPARDIYTIVNARPDVTTQQCLITVHPAAASGAQSATRLFEGTYAIDMIGGGGGGAAGAARRGGGGGGAGATPIRSVQYLSPGVYKLTIGAGGAGGKPFSSTPDGNLSSITNADTGAHVAGARGADVRTQTSTAPSLRGSGGVAGVGGSSGGDGGQSGSIENGSIAQAGGASQTAGYAGTGGQAGSSGSRDEAGGGGAGVGSGGSGQAATGSSGMMGNLGAGGAGGRGMGSQDGAPGGHGYIKLTMTQPAPRAAAVAPAPAAIAQAPMVQTESLSADSLFAFGKSTLKPAGETKLNDLVGKLKGGTSDSITVTGHADRIGSSEKNQQLSLDRANAVKAYMVTKGVQADRIAVAGKGETEPVTNADSCKGPTTSKVIACLQPDRRVDIVAVVTSK